jgi:hypothetical protein
MAPLAPKMRLGHAARRVQEREQEHMTWLWTCGWGVGTITRRHGRSRLCSHDLQRTVMASFLSRGLHQMQMAEQVKASWQGRR